jgi:hypothetical protein
VISWSTVAHIVAAACGLLIWSWSAWSIWRSMPGSQKKSPLLVSAGSTGRKAEHWKNRSKKSDADG